MIDRSITAVSERQLSFLESELGSGPRLGPLEDMFIFTILLFQNFNKRQVPKLGHRTDTRQVYFSLKSKLYTLLAAKCVSLSLQVIATQHTSPSFPASVLHIKGKSGKHRTLPYLTHSTVLSINRVLNGLILATH